MSPPFDLYQGEQGFVFYLPLNRNKQFLGWYGIVVSKKRFFDQFLHQGPFRNFHILLSDAETGKEYISTGVPPVETEEFRLREAKFRALGREIRMLTWHKAPQIFSHEWPLLTAITLAIATLMTASWEFFSQRKQSRRQVAELNALLGHIIHDTTNSVTTIKGYVEMMKDDPQLVPLDRVAKHVGFVVDLLDQIKLVRSLSDASISWTQVRQPILPLVIEAGELLDHRLQAKRLSLSYNPDTLGPLQSVLNSNLFIHAVLTNILSAMIELSQVGSQITVGQCTVDGEMRLHFVNPLARGLLEKSAELSLQIAVKVMELQHGHCKVDLSSNGLSVQITLPA